MVGGGACPNLEGEGGVGYYIDEMEGREGDFKLFFPPSILQI